MNASVKHSISEVLGVSAPLDASKYLGFPSLIGKSKRAIFGFLKDGLWKRLQGWRNRFLSRARKEILIKSVAHAIPSYCKGIFLIPLALCDEF